MNDNNQEIEHNEDKEKKEKTGRNSEIPIYAPILFTIILPMLSSKSMLALSSKNGSVIIVFVWLFYYMYNDREGFLWEFKNNKLFWGIQFIGDPLLMILLFKGFVGAFIIGSFIYLPLFVYSLVSYKSYKKNNDKLNQN